MLFRSVFSLVVLASAPALAQVVPKGPEPATLKANAEMAKNLPFADRQDFDDAMKGFVGTVPDALVPGTGQRPPVWSMKPYEFLKQEGAADSVNPSLWRQAQLNTIHGLFKVTERVYQVRGFDISNMTIVEGDSGLIVIDTLGSPDTARAALDLYYQHRPKKPVGTVIYTHSHADHFGGVKGVTSEADVASGKVQLLAPAGFNEAVAGEVVLAGTAMGRRVQYQLGVILPPGPRGHVDSGIGKAIGRAPIGLIAPTTMVEHDETRTIDGVQVTFHMAPGSEAPAEMLIFLPQFGVLDMAEDVNHTMHNLYTLRGSEVRDGNLWSRYIGEALDMFGDKTDVVIGQHTWPVAGRERVAHLLATQRDLYKFINDQSLRLINHGLTPSEIAETLHMPASLEREWSARGYYGTLSHNSKAVYQKYLGWYDANPSNLNPLPPVENARKTVEYMGGADAVIARAREDFRKGEYRWVASATNQVVFADPANRAARELCADALEQMGYQAEFGAVARRLSRGRGRAAQRHAEDPRPGHRQRRHDKGADYACVLRLSRQPSRCDQSRGQGDDHQRRRHRPAAAIRAHTLQLGAHLGAGPPGRRCRRDAHRAAPHARCAGAPADELVRGGEGGVSQDRGRRRQARRIVRHARHLQRDVRGGRTQGGREVSRLL